MSEINVPVKLCGVGFYSAPSDRIVRSVGIGPGEELCEVLTGGKVFFEQDGELRTFGRGTIFWHIAGDETICRTPPEDPYRCLTIRFSVKEDRRVMPRVSRWTDEAGFGDFVNEAIHRFHDEAIDRDILCDYLHRRLLWEAYLGNRRNRQASYPKPLVRALELLHGADTFHFSVSEMARHAGVSEPYLYALFSRHLHSSPHQYLLNYRLRLARTRLASSDDNIKEIAEACGFENLESFYRAFRRNTGMPPGEFRRSQQPTDA